MKQFIKFTFASCLGLAIAMSILIFIGLIFAGSAISSANKGDKVKLKDNSILVANFDAPIPEYTDNVNSTDPMSAFNPTKQLGVHDMAALISKAATDPKIKALLLEPKNASFGLATGDILRESLEEFRAEGKKIYAYAESMNQKTYYLLSEADSIFMNPNGTFDFRGFGAMIPHFKDMLDKLGVEMQIYYAGKFKSATEPFRLNKMSDQNRLQTREFLNDMYDSYLLNISENRDIPVETLRDYANNFTIRTSEKAVEYGLIDAIAHRQDVIAILRDKVNTRDREKLGTLNLTDYLSASSVKKKTSKTKDKIAIVYAEGSINSGKEKAGAIQSDHYAKIFRKISRDNNIKGVVFRINSGGGSFMASEDIAHEIDLIREKGIPVIASFGDYAASGGYYIGCVADTIVCQENTLTGSIGVFGMIPSVENLLNEKAGIHFDTVGTGKFATGFTPFFKFSNEENAIIQEGVDDAYIKFKTHVAEERGWNVSDVEEVAQGRVWSGRKAKELGLIDILGDLDAAIDICVSKAGLEDFKKVEYPKLKDPFTLLMEKLMGGEIKMKVMENEIEKYFPYYQTVKNSIETREPVAALPMIVNYN